MTKPSAAHTDDDLDALLERVRACRHCEASLPLGPRPVLAAHPDARVLIVGQAPGTRVHETGIPWNDPSGDRLRDWLGVDRDAFYDPRRFAIVPMGFCYPGRGKSGDLPPRKECARLWRRPLLERLPRIRLTLLIGRYAQAWHLGNEVDPTLTATVRRFRDFLPDIIVTPHPSPRNQLWLKKNPWFEADLVPELRGAVANALGDRTEPR